MEPYPIEVRLRNLKLLTLLCTNFNGPYALTVIPSAKYLVSLVAMISLYVALRVKVPHGMDYCLLVVFVCAAAYATFLANVLTVIWSTSKNFLVELRIAVADIGNLERRVRLRREQKSLRSLRICIGGLYYMEAEAKLTFMHFVVNGTGNLLIAFK